MNRRRALIVCPGRGSYTKESLGYLKSRTPQVRELIGQMDQRRQMNQLPSLTELDSMPSFKPSLHTKGEHASSLIYSCSYGDHSCIDWDLYEPVAVTGNSMGWYTACVLAGAVDPLAGFDLVETMGSMMSGGLIGGQVIHSLAKEDWSYCQKQKEEILKVIEDIKREGARAEVSIFLGGHIVIGADRQGVKLLLERLPKKDKFPFQLINHGAFHTSLLQEVSERAFQEVSIESFNSPKVDLIDGRGQVWKSYSCDREKIREYTLGHQVHSAYDFTAAMTKGLKEYNPDCVILLGPGNSLGSAVGQILVNLAWKGMKTKEQFIEQQKGENPFVLSLGIEEQALQVMKI